MNEKSSIRAWLAADPSRRHRLMAYIAVCLAFAIGLFRVESIAKTQVHDADERRIQGRALLYQGCHSLNGLREALDDTFHLLFAQAMSNPDTDRYRVSRSLDILRGNLAPTDCEHVLADLTDEEKAEARARANGGAPSLPLPPPTAPGYLPPTTPPAPND